MASIDHQTFLALQMAIVSARCEGGPVTGVNRGLYCWTPHVTRPFFCEYCRRELLGNEEAPAPQTETYAYQYPQYQGHEQYTPGYYNHDYFNYQGYYGQGYSNPEYYSYAYYVPGSSYPLGT